MKKRSRTAYAVLGAFPQVIGYAVAPVVVARSGRRHGWVNDRFSRANRAGMVPMGAGAGLIAWAIASHYQEAPEESRVMVIPDYLVTTGAYSVSRNPLYVGGGLLWAGWAVFFGNVRVAMAGAGWLTFIATVGVPFEERLLGRKFGDVYHSYCARVPRWVGFTTRAG